LLNDESCCPLLFDDENFESDRDIYFTFLGKELGDEMG
jgi:hypothetical protein